MPNVSIKAKLTKEEKKKLNELRKTYGSYAEVLRVFLTERRELSFEDKEELLSKMREIDKKISEISELANSILHFLTFKSL